MRREAFRSLDKNTILDYVQPANNILKWTSPSLIINSGLGGH
jgi:hypothetical protein